VTRHASSVNFRHLLDDLVDLYPFPVEEAVLAELVANALDAGAQTVHMETDPGRGVFWMRDDGRGMGREEFWAYHDFAVSFKRKGRGIGFAGLGAKLGVKVSHEVVTESRSQSFWGASRWFFEGDQLLWEEVEARRIHTQGTVVELRLRDRSSRLLDPPELRRMLARHYMPLLDPYFQEIYREAGVYPHGVAFWINGQPVSLTLPAARSRHDFYLRLGKRRRPAGVGYFLMADEPLEEELQGVGLCTFGKVILRDWFRKFPADPERITGLVEVPELVSALTTNKCDFHRAGTEGQRYYRVYREIQSELGHWLESLGELLHPPRAPRDAGKLERLLRDILSTVPELGELLGSLARPAREGTAAEPGEDVRATAFPPESEEPKTQGEAGERREGAGVPRRRRLGGLQVAWVKGGTDRLMGWVDGDTVLINEDHPAFAKARDAGLKEYHDLLSVAVALLEHRGGDGPSDTLDVLSRYFAAWGRL